MWMTHIYETVIAGRPLKVEVGKVAKQANGAAMLFYGDTTVLVTATGSKKPREGIDFFPLTVDYEERMYAVGKIPGGFIKREGRPTETATLSARLIDRPMRPLFPKGYRNDVHIVATIMSVEQDNSPDVTAIIGASIALSVSDIPFSGPVGAVIIGMVDGELVVNPTAEQAEKSDMHLTVAGTKDAIMMVEAGANEIPEAKMLDAIFLAHDVIKEIVAFQEKIVAEIGKPKATVELAEIEPEIEAAVREYSWNKIREAVQCPDKLLREEQTDEAMKEILDHFEVVFPERSDDVMSVLERLEKEIVREMILNEGKRVDGRALNEVRQITCEVGVLPRPHGSGLFTRGQTQVLSVTTLGAASEEQILDGLGVAVVSASLNRFICSGEVFSLEAPNCLWLLKRSCSSNHLSLALSSAFSCSSLRFCSSSIRILSLSCSIFFRVFLLRLYYVFLVVLRNSKWIHLARQSAGQ
jgi:polyribonucleotide nucleotidyltransferase